MALLYLVGEWFPNDFVRMDWRFLSGLWQSQWRKATYCLNIFKSFHVRTLWKMKDYYIEALGHSPDWRFGSVTWKRHQCPLWHHKDLIFQNCEFYLTFEQAKDQKTFIILGEFTGSLETHNIISLNIVLFHHIQVVKMCQIYQCCCLVKWSL